MAKKIGLCVHCNRTRQLVKSKHSVEPVCEECAVDLEGDHQQRIFMESLQKMKKEHAESGSEDDGSSEITYEY